MSKLYEANAAIELLTEVYHMSDDEALNALDFAEDSGEWESGRLSVTCMGRGVFEVERR